MEYKQIQNAYDENGLTDYKLKNVKDLLLIHKVDFKIDGYEELSQEDKDLYKKFIINFFNAWGLGTREDIKPKAISFVKNTDSSGSAKGYLKFEYTQDGRGIWLHVINEKQWY